MKRTLRTPLFFVAHHTLRRIHLGTPDNRAGGLFRRLGFFGPPPPSEVIANFLRGYILFGREFSKEAWFHWYWIPSRSVITSATATVPSKMAYLFRRTGVEVRFDQDFDAILEHCREGRQGWLTAPAAEVYRQLFQLGFASCVGTYKDGKLVGGLWGVSIGRTFSIMSVFHLQNDTGTLATAALTRRVLERDRWLAIDCGSHTSHFARFGANEMPVELFCALITANLQAENLPAESAGFPISAAKWGVTSGVAK